MDIIEVHQLAKTFTFHEKDEHGKGLLRQIFSRKTVRREAVKGVSFAIGQGEIVGFLGPNGAGKSTTLKMLSGILHPTAGTASIMGFIPWERKNGYKRQFSFVAGQKSQLWPDLPAHESFRLYQTIYDIPDAQYKAQLHELIELLGVAEHLNVQVRRLSLGERMKMELIASLLHRPKVLFLDEPTIGLDILSQDIIRSFLRDYNRLYGTTILLTSHYMGDIEALCDHTIVINRGEKVYDGPLQSIRALSAGTRLIKLKFSEAVGAEQLASFGRVIQQEPMEATLEVQGQARAVASAMLAGLPVLDIGIEDVPIEQSIAHLFSADKGGSAG